MRSYVKLYADFWRDHRNAELINLGMDAQFLAMYLLANPHSNMLGVYFLPLPYIAIDIKEPTERIEAALQKLCDINYCQYDKVSQYIWVCDMVAEQVGSLDIKDNRLKPIQTIWNSLPPLPFLEAIYQKYHAPLHLEPRVFPKTTRSIWSNPSTKMDVPPSEGGTATLLKG